ncbi:MAG: hypothetical protein F9K32_08995 [Desulfobulbaceae bacterium]|nr:MAG: hypothetical protein F9K32_08995 [Desulfobulbaceae bacterium]
MRQCIRIIAMTCIITLLAFGQAPAAVPQYRLEFLSSTELADNALNIWLDTFVEEEAGRILAVLDDRIKDPEILAKAREKLETMPIDEIRLVASLCDRVSAAKEAPRADIAFSLVTALIVLS